MPQTAAPLSRTSNAETAESAERTMFSADSACSALSSCGQAWASESEPGEDLHAPHGTRRGDLAEGRRVDHRIDRRELDGVEDVVCQDLHREIARRSEAEVPGQPGVQHGCPGPDDR